MTAKALFLDISGVLYQGKEPIEGAAQAVDEARSRGLVLRFVTNTATDSRRNIIDKLAGMGIDIEENELFTAPLAARAYLQEHDLRPFCLVHPAIDDEFEDLEQSDPNCVLLGDAREKLTYKSLNEAFRLCMDGAPLIGIGLNKYFKDETGLNLDAGPFIRALEWALDTEALIMGKPNRAFFDQVVASVDAAADKCLMVGDDVHSDVVAAIDAGLDGCLVKTGKYRAGDENALAGRGRVIDSIADLFTDSAPPQGPW